MAGWLAQASGGWSSIGWNANTDGSGDSGTPVAGDVLYANGYDVTLDNTIDAAGMSFVTATANGGGSFSIPAGISLTPSGPFSVGFPVYGNTTGSLSVSGGSLDCVNGVHVTPGSTLVVGMDGSGNRGSLTGVYSPGVGGVILAAGSVGESDGIGRIGGGQLQLNGGLVDALPASMPGPNAVQINNESIVYLGPSDLPDYVLATDVVDASHVDSPYPTYTGGPQGTLDLSDLVAGNIKNTVTIAGVTGSYDPMAAAVFPAANQVSATIQYGPTGADYTGTLTGGGGLTTDEHNALFAIQAKTDNLPADPAAALASADFENIADAVLSRGVAGVEASADEHSLCFVVLALSESNTTANANMLTVFRSDGTTEFVQKALTSSAAAEAITGVS